MFALSTAGCGSGDSIKKKAKKRAAVTAVKARKTSIVEILQTTGDVVATNTVTLQATVEGPVSFCPWREGDFIEKAGRKLIEINRPLYRQRVAAAEAALATARAKLADLKAGARPEEIAIARESVRHFEDCTEFAEADLARFKSLVESDTLPAEMAEKARVDYVKCHTELLAAKERLAMLEAGPTKTEIAVLEAAAEEAAAQLSLSKAKLDECLLKAPFAGIVTEVYVRPGDLATPRGKLLKMMAPDSLVVRGGIAESSAAYIRKGAEAKIRLDAYPERTFTGQVERVYPRLEWDSRTRLVEVRITEPVKLMPRLFARLEIKGRTVPDAIVVPDAALVTTPQGATVVYVIDAGVAVKREVKVGIEQEQRIQITAGVQAGEPVVVAGNLNLKAGAPVKAEIREFAQE